MALSDLPRIGYGAASLSSVYGHADPEESKATLRKAIEIGCKVWDTSDLYGFSLGFGHNETLLGSVIAEFDRSKAFIVTKYGFSADFKLNGSKEYARTAIDASIKRLGTTPDAWIIHRTPKDVEIREVMESLEEARKEGKTKWIGLSEPSAKTIREAMKYGRVDFIESEYSPFCLDLEDRGILKVCKELDIYILAFCPLGRGFLTGSYTSAEEMESSRKAFSPKFAKENFEKNYKIVEALEKVAVKKGITKAQVTLAWIMAQDSHLIPIPATRSAERVQENFGALEVKLTEEELKELREAFVVNRPDGDRYNAAGQAGLDLD